MDAKLKRIEIRAVICIWCGKAITYPTEASKEVVYEAMKEHDLTCAKHPLQITIQQQAATIERLGGVLWAFAKLKCTAIASEGGELRITFNRPIAGGTSIKNWNDKLDEARQAIIDYRRVTQ